MVDFFVACDALDNNLAVDDVYRTREKLEQIAGGTPKRRVPQLSDSVPLSLSRGSSLLSINGVAASSAVIAIYREDNHESKY